MNYDEKDRERERVGDWDLADALEYNCDPVLNIGHIESVLAVVEGEPDGADYHWVVELKEARDGKKFAYVTGGCDYTGWDCQSSAYFTLFNSALEAVMGVNEDSVSGYSEQDVDNLRQDLAGQILKQDKAETFHDQKAELREPVEGVEPLKVSEDGKPEADKPNPLGLDDDFLGRNFECGCRMTIIANSIKIEGATHDQLTFNFCEDHEKDEVLHVHRMMLHLAAAGGSIHRA